MITKKILTIAIAGMLLLTLAACTTRTTQTESTSALAADTLSADAAKAASAEENALASSETTLESGAGSVAEALSQNSEDHDQPDDYSWDQEDVVEVHLDGDSATAEDDRVSIEGTTITITAPGTYRFSGSLQNGQLRVDSEDDGLVRLVLNGVEIHSSTTAPIYIKNASKAIIVLAEGTQNTLSDAATYIFEDPEQTEPNAALYSADDLTISGGGLLQVTGSYQDGIASEDGLVIASGSITVQAADDAIRGKDYLVIKAGTFTLDGGGDGLKSDNEADTGKGYILVESGEFSIESGGDAIHAQTDLLITSGTFSITAGGGSDTYTGADLSAKGLKAAVNLVIEAGSFIIDAADDAVHSNGYITVNGGSFTIASADDGFHADASLAINDGTIHITHSYEGLESAVITILSGDIQISAEDDAINIAGGGDNSGFGRGQGWEGRQPPGMDQDPGAAAGQGDFQGQQGGRQAPGTMQGPGGFPGQDAFAVSGNYKLTISGGTIRINAGGDGIDANGNIEMSGGVVLVNGPTENMNGALDCIGTFEISGGLLVAVGSAGMAEAPGETSTQNSLLLNFSAPLSAGTLIQIRTSTGEEILSFEPSKTFQSIAFSSGDLLEGGTYEVYLDGVSYTRFTVTGALTRIGQAMRR